MGQSRLRFRAELLDRITDVVVVLDHGGCIACLNKAAQQRFGIEGEEARGKSLNQVMEFQWLQPESRLAAEAALAGAGSWRGEMVVVGLDGKQSLMESVINPIDAGHGSVTVMRTVGARRGLDELKDEFIGLVSHELGSPLTVIVGALNTVLAEGARLPEEERLQLLKDAVWEAETLSQLVRNLLELSRIQANRVSLYREVLDVPGLVGDTIARIKRRYEIRHVTSSFPEQLPVVYADAVRVQMVLHNLVENAVKYSEPGTPVSIAVKAEPSRIVLAVSDQGPGLTPAQLGALFGPFHHLHLSTAEGVKGAGLGLYVSRRLVEAHGGSLWVDTAPGRGAAFYFSLPVIAARAW